MSFTWSETITADVTPIRASHVTEIRTNIDDIAGRQGVVSFSWLPLAAGDLIERTDYAALRDNLDAIHDNNYCQTHYAAHNNLEKASHHDTDNKSDDGTHYGAQNTSVDGSQFGTYKSGHDNSYDGVQRQTFT